jgi:hypothetical protein
MAVPGVAIVGRQPPALNTEAVFSAALFAASPQMEAGRAFLARLAAETTPDLLRAKGLEPA